MILILLIFILIIIIMISSTIIIIIIMAAWWEDEEQIFVTVAISETKQSPGTAGEIVIIITLIIDYHYCQHHDYPTKCCYQDLKHENKHIRHSA